MILLHSLRDRSAEAVFITTFALLAIACAGDAAVPFAPRDREEKDGGDGDGDGGGGDPPDPLIGVTTGEQIDMLVEANADIEDPSKICAGWDHSCAIDRDGKPWCWGSATAKIDPPDDLPVLIKIACGAVHTCALGDDEKIYCWGEGESDDIDGFTLSNQGQSAVPDGDYKDVALGANSLSSCAINTDDELVCWGAGDDNAPATAHVNFGQARPPVGFYKNVTVGDAHACAIKLETEAVYCWGGGGIDGCFPTTSFDCGQVDAPSGQFVQINAGSYHTCGIRDDDEVVCWGLGQTSDDCEPNADSAQPHFECGQSKVPDDIDGVVVRVNGGTLHSCALSEFYKGTCWGWNDSRQNVVPEEDFAQLAPGDSHTCGIRTDGEVVCWGTGTAARVPESFPGVY